MEALGGIEAFALPGIDSAGGRRLRAFRALDAWAVEACHTALLVGQNQKEGSGIGGEILRAVARAGGALVAACGCDPGSPGESDELEISRARLLEARYHLYLARRLGLFDVRRYKALTVRQEAALREIQTLLKDRTTLREASRPP